MHGTKSLPIAVLVLGLALSCGCVHVEGRLAGYGCKRPAPVIDPRGVPVEPCCHCGPVDPTCSDTNACCQLKRTRETFFDSLYALICECNLRPNSDCCHYSCR